MLTDWNIVQIDENGIDNFISNLKSNS
jgi:hypothetical protein